MTFRFIHTGDWHVGKRFRKFLEDLAGELAAERLNVIERIGDLARRSGNAPVLVAGDIFDRDDLGDVELRRVVERLAIDDNINWYLLPGNHDPHRPGGVWDRLSRGGLPSNVFVLSQAEAVPLGDDVVLLPSPLSTHDSGRDPTAWMADADCAGKQIKIGLAHGSVQNFGSDSPASTPINTSRAMSSGLSYLALGDWHGTKKIGDRCWYAGTPEPERYIDNDPGNVLLVSVMGHAQAEIEKVATGRFRWLGGKADIRSLSDVRALEARFGDDRRAQQRTLVRLKLSGSLPLNDAGALNELIDFWRARLKDLDIDQDDILWRSDREDLASLSDDVGIYRAALHLAEIADGKNTDEAQVASDALIDLYNFVAEVRSQTEGQG